MAERLKVGDEIRVIAPSRSGAILKSEQIDISVKRLEALGFRVTFSKNFKNYDLFYQSSIEERIEDLHEAFLDPKVKMILTAIGGYNSNQLLDYIDYDIIRNNPKIFCGYSDITALNNAIYHKTGLINYSGPHFSTLGMKHGLDYTMDYFLQAITNDSILYIEPSKEWSNDLWYLNQEDRTFYPNEGYFIINEGQAEGKILGGNLCTFNLLQGTKFMPDLTDSILFIEDDNESHSQMFDRDLQSLLHQPNANKIKAIIIGRFEKESQVTKEGLRLIIQSKKELQHIPVIANVDFGHTSPIFTIPIGGTCTVKVSGGIVELILQQK